MKILYTIVLFLLSFSSYAQKERLLFKVTSRLEYVEGEQNPRKIDPIEMKGLLVFKSKEVRFNNGEKWADTVYEVITIKKGKNKHEQRWETKDIDFVFDLRKEYLTAHYNRSRKIIIYFGYLYFGYNPTFD